MHSEATNRMADVGDRLHALCDSLPFTTSWHVRDFTSGLVAERAGDVPTPSASTRKVLYLMAAMKAVHEGRMDLQERVVVDSELQQGAVSGVLYHMTPGLAFPLRDALLQMIITSDNTCTSLVGDRIGVQGLNDFCAFVGMTDTSVRHIVPPRDMPHDAVFDFVASTTPRDQALLLQMILDGSQREDAAGKLGCSVALCQLALDIMTRQVHRIMIPGLLPIDTRFAGKTGGGRNGVMDVGIVYRAGAPLFSLTAYTHHVPWTMPDGLPGHAIARQTIARLGRICWDGLGVAT